MLLAKYSKNNYIPSERNSLQALNEYNAISNRKLISQKIENLKKQNDKLLILKTEKILNYFEKEFKKFKKAFATNLTNHIASLATESIQILIKQSNVDTKDLKLKIQKSVEYLAYVYTQLSFEIVLSKFDYDNVGLQLSEKLIGNKSFINIQKISFEQSIKRGEFIIKNDLIKFRYSEEQKIEEVLEKIMNNTPYNLSLKGEIK